MRLSYSIIIPALLLTGCSKELSPLQREIILDYQYWIEDNIDRVQEYLDEETRVDHNISGLPSQSWESDYLKKNIKDEEVIAKARPWGDKVYINEDSHLWIFIEEDYLYHRGIWDSCGEVGDGVFYGFKAANAAYVLCHENAHNLKIKSHQDVYVIGDACKEIYMDDVSVWIADCKDEKDKKDK